MFLRVRTVSFHMEIPRPQQQHKEWSVSEWQTGGWVRVSQTSQGADFPSEGWQGWLSIADGMGSPESSCLWGLLCCKMLFVRKESAVRKRKMVSASRSSREAVRDLVGVCCITPHCLPSCHFPSCPLLFLSRQPGVCMDAHAEMRKDAGSELLLHGACPCCSCWTQLSVMAAVACPLPRLSFYCQALSLCVICTIFFYHPHYLKMSSLCTLSLFQAQAHSDMMGWCGDGDRSL